jgi:hypothetical protein
MNHGGKGREGRWLLSLARATGKRKHFDLCGACYEALMEWSRRPLRLAARANRTISGDVPGQQVVWETGT